MTEKVIETNNYDQWPIFSKPVFVIEILSLLIEKEREACIELALKTPLWAYCTDESRREVQAAREGIAKAIKERNENFSEALDRLAFHLYHLNT